MLEIVAGALLAGGGFFGLVGGAGLLRFPDFYSRLHAAGITDTICALLVILGLAVSIGWSLLMLKLLMILLFLLFTAPTATHALARAAVADGLRPETSGEPPSKG
ncbi:monovalent cation/H(+) antiporter subunit G [Luteimonas vadosa]|uniref:Monovalent cation/H(+) antiporter subunit G n=2 Tax=Luteimonas vadosa TaxID=1165507 RepID=A0ABP9DPQ3_9GAMM